MDAIARLLPHEPALEALYCAGLLARRLEFEVQTDVDREALRAAVAFAYDALMDELAGPSPRPIAGTN